MSARILDVAVRGPSSSKLLRVLLETIEALMTNWFQIKTVRLPSHLFFFCCATCSLTTG